MKIHMDKLCMRRTGMLLRKGGGGLTLFPTFFQTAIYLEFSEKKTHFEQC